MAPVDGTLVKLMIVPYDTSKAFADSQPSGPPFVAQINPAEYTDAVQLQMNSDETPQGADGNEAKVKGIEPRSFTLELKEEGSGALDVDGRHGSTPSSAQSLQDRLNAFRETVGFSGEVHRQRFLHLVWGTLSVSCALESYSVNYKLFDPQGNPLRADLSATFIEHKDPEVQEKEKNLASPDITHGRLVHEGDTLPNVVYGIYRDPGRYLDVARANGLNTVRQLDSGSELILPPVR
ncbi:hypothetical protein [Tateyamaria sp. syn59]|uniref:CIS tube protein n=1 Tax=Tateyamaria sp. syn59 TaxID=2576942 RepID=UPI0011BF083B|nr:hypothetical protein [Tateyamaria sp. syn59]